MARIARVVGPGIPHHITQRGNRRQQTFFGEEDFREYISLMGEWCKEYGTEVWAYCLMSNHVHLIAQSSNGKLSDTIRDFKKFTSKRIIETLETIPESRSDWMLNRFSFNARQHSTNTTYQVWTHENHAVYLYSPKFIREKIDYLHNNPVRAGLVEKPEDYLYSSARNYADIEGVIDVIKIDTKWNNVS